jgi:hypothetical protein
MRKRFFLISLIVMILGCDQNEEIVKEYSLPKGAFIDNNCFLSDQGVWVHFNGYKCEPLYYFYFDFTCYPLIDSVGNVLTSPKAFWRNLNTIGSIPIPGNYLTGVSRFSMKVEMVCDNQKGKVNAEFELKEKDSNCKVWEVVSFSNSN